MSDYLNRSIIYKGNNDTLLGEIKRTGCNPANAIVIINASGTLNPDKEIKKMALEIMHLAKVRMVLPKADPEREFMALLDMARIIPENVATVVSHIKSKSGIFLGFVEQYIEGCTLDDFIIPKLKIAESGYLLNKLSCIVRRLHKNNIPHGDLHTGNVLVDKNMEIKLIDPAFYGHSTSMSANAIKKDKRDLKGIFIWWKSQLLRQNHDPR